MPLGPRGIDYVTLVEEQPSLGREGLFGAQHMRPPKITVRGAVLGSLILALLLTFFTLFGYYVSSPVHPPDGHVLPHGSRPLTQ